MPKKAKIVYDRLANGSNGTYVVSQVIPLERFHLLASPAGLPSQKNLERVFDTVLPCRSWEVLSHTSFSVERAWFTSANECALFVRETYDSLPFDDEGTLVIVYRPSQRPGGVCEVGAFCCASTEFSLAYDERFGDPPWAALVPDAGTKAAAPAHLPASLWERLARDEF